MKGIGRNSSSIITGKCWLEMNDTVTASITIVGNLQVNRSSYEHAWRILVQQMQETASDCKKRSRGGVKEKRKMISEQNDQLVP
uniref:Uncharacterized protein n=1 Tax=Salix viminalis TaxID=40686 RepID=A0A6N2LLR1_SALVM